MLPSLSSAMGHGKLKLKLQPDVIELAYGCNHRLVSRWSVRLSVCPLVAPIISLIAFAAICNHNKLLLVGAGKKQSMHSSSNPNMPMNRHTELAVPHSDCHLRIGFLSSLPGCASACVTLLLCVCVHVFRPCFVRLCYL